MPEDLQAQEDLVMMLTRFLWKPEVESGNVLCDIALLLNGSQVEVSQVWIFKSPAVHMSSDRILKIRP